MTAIRVTEGVVDAQYVILQPDPDLPNARQLITGSGIILTDNPASGTLTISIDSAYIQTLVSASTRTVSRASVTQRVPAGTNVTFGSNLDASLANYTGKNFSTNVDVFLNGRFLWPGILSSSCDVYPGDSPASGDLKFTDDLMSGSVVSLIVY
jgi:hypothetical protein